MKSDPFLLIMVMLLGFTPVLAQDGGFSVVSFPDDIEVGQPRFTPGQPAIGEQFAVFIDVDGCMLPDRNPDEQLSEVRVGSDKRIAVLISVLAFNPMCALVSPPPPPQRFTQQLPGLEEGTWGVDIFTFDPSETFPQDVSGLEPFASAEVVVRGQLAPQTIPTLSPIPIFVLMLALALIGIRRVRVV